MQDNDKDINKIQPIEPVSEAPQCSHGEDAIRWNEYNGVVQCHMCGQIFDPRQSIEPVPSELMRPFVRADEEAVETTRRMMDAHQAERAAQRPVPSDEVEATWQAYDDACLLSWSKPDYGPHTISIQEEQVYLREQVEAIIERRVQAQYEARIDEPGNLYEAWLFSVRRAEAAERERDALRETLQKIWMQPCADDFTDAHSKCCVCGVIFLHKAKNITHKDGCIVTALAETGDAT